MDTAFIAQLAAIAHYDNPIDAIDSHAVYGR